MRVREGRRTFVHCVANKRVSAFVYLYRVLHRGVPEEQTRTDMREIWQPDEVWSRPIAEQIDRR